MIRVRIAEEKEMVMPLPAFSCIAGRSFCFLTGVVAACHEHEPER
jgi:hypothetical protein